VTILKIEGDTVPLKEKELTFALRRAGDGGVCLCIVDAAGKVEWRVATIRADGTLYRCSGLSSNIGLRTDGPGRIIMSEVL
jgi:hypothetical protein